MNQPTAPNTVEDFLPLPHTRHGIDHYHDDGSVTCKDGYTADQMRAYVLADRAQRPITASPTVAGSVTRWHHNEFSKEMHPDPIGEYVAFSDLAPAAPSGEAKPVGYVHLVPDGLSPNYDVRFWEPVSMGAKLYTHPAPSSPTAPRLPAQAVPEDIEAVELPEKPISKLMAETVAADQDRSYIVIAYTGDQLDAYATEAVLKDRAALKGMK